LSCAFAEHGKFAEADDREVALTLMSAERLESSMLRAPSW